MTLQQLESFCYDLLDSDADTTMATLSDAELQTAYTTVLRQYGLELVIGAEDSGWMSDLLMIGNNQGPILACHTAFSAILLEMARRGIDRPGDQEQPR